ncbi:MAG: helix-turn-helix domain-containing protein [Candidatus Methanomethyliaceae archaeon]
MDFPEPIVRAIEALDSRERRKILQLLQDHGGLSYSAICKKMEGRIVKGTLSYHLNKLEAAGLISNYVKTDLGKESRYSFYKCTPLCIKLVYSIFKSFEGN